MTYKHVYCTVCKTNHQMTKVKNGWYCFAKSHKQRSGKFITYWKTRTDSNSNLDKVGKDNTGLKQTEPKGKKSITSPTTREFINAESSLSVPAHSSQPNTQKLSEFDEYLKAISKKNKLCLACLQPIEGVRSKGAKYCINCAEERTSQQMKDSMQIYNAKGRAKTNRKKYLKNQLKKIGG